MLCYYWYSTGDKEVLMASPMVQDGAGRQTLLVVDDNTAVHHALSNLSGNGELHCVHAADSVEGLCRIVEHRPTVVLLDSQAGPLDAWRFALLVKEHPEYRHIRLVLLGTEVDDALRARAEAVGIEAVLAKPFTSEELQASLYSTSTRSA